jgi:hypothetical protein
MTSLTLYELTADYMAVLERACALEEPDDQILADLERVAGDLQTKAMNVAGMIRHLESMASAIGAAAVKMEARGKAVTNRANHLRDYRLHHMDAAGITRIESPEMVVLARRYTPAVIVDDLRQVPAEFIRPPKPADPAPDKMAIRKAIEAGQDVPGCRLESKLGLEIR